MTRDMPVHLNTSRLKSESQIGVRIAVLRLAAAHADDRAWVLNQLSSPQRQRIDALLVELTMLGITDFGPWVGELVQQLPEDLSTSSVPVCSAPHHAWWASLLLESAKRGDTSLTLAEQLALENQMSSAKVTDGLLPLPSPPLPPALADALRNSLLAGTAP